MSQITYNPKSRKELRAATARARVNALEKQKRLRLIEVKLANLRRERKQLQQES